jgi:hypothetical protein
MANTLTIAKTATSVIDLTSTAYDLIEADEPAPNYQRETRSGCGSKCGSRVVKRQLVDMTLPITIMTKGADGNTRMDLRDTLLAGLEAAVAYEVQDTEGVNYDGMPRFVHRVVGNQSPEDWYQITDYDTGFPAKRNQNKFTTMNVTLKVWPGQKLPCDADLTGLTVTNVLGGIGRVILGSDGFPVTIGTL